MALIVPTTTRVCLNCKINSDTNAGKEFHEIFDDVGLELQLPSLIETFFHIDLKKKDKQHLCDDCVNRLIELYDVVVHTNDESCKTNNLKNKPECSNKEGSSKYLQNERRNFRYEDGNLHKPFVIDQKNAQVNLHKSNSIEYTNFKTFVSTQGENAIEINKQSKSEDIHRTEYENIEDVGYFFNQNRSAPFTQQQNQSSNDITEDFPVKDFKQTGEREVSQNLNMSSFSPKSEKRESNEHIEFISDDENHMGINKQSNTNITFGSKKFETKEREGSQDFIISLSSSENSNELESNENIVFISDDENEYVEIYKQSNTNNIVDLCEEEDEAVEVYIPNKIHNKNEDQEYSYVVEVDNLSNQVISSDDSNSLLEELKTTEENKASLLNVSCSAIDFNNIEHIDTDDVIKQEDISIETCSLVEDCFKEEIILSKEYDQVDLDEYLDKVLITKFQDLLLNWEIECKLCLEKYYSFVELLNHACMAEFEKKQQFFCIIEECEEDAKDLPTLARHLVLKHYDKLESTSIFGKCTACQKTFSSVLDFNKHSCCQNIKRKTGAPNYCKYCDLDFQSLKRYVFHMQFHLKKRRPKICLLCGDLFNNSNDFFEHTQYKHNPLALTCLRCDRFFKDKQVFSNHMELHEDSKYQYECTLCPKKYTHNFTLNRHMDIYHNKTNAVQCEYCPKKFSYKTSYRNHLKTHASDAKVQTFICSTCGLITKNMEMIKDHIESDNKSPCFSSPVEEKILDLGYSCENCSLDFCTITHLKDHRLSDSHSDDLFHCGMCRKSFNTLKHMRNHSSKHKNFQEWQESFPITRYFVCNIGDCEEFYSIWTSLYYHKQRPHTTEENANSPTEFKCQFCQRLYYSKMRLALHITRSHYNVSSKCSYCKKNFKSQNILQQHIDQFHTPVECDICLKKFKHGRTLKKHISSIHNNKNIEKGNDVHQKLRYLHEKKVHHKNTFICKLCNFETTCPASLKIHVGKHTSNNGLKFKCSICSKSFGRKPTLEDHLKKHHNKR